LLLATGNLGSPRSAAKRRGAMIIIARKMGKTFEMVFMEEILGADKRNKGYLSETRVDNFRLQLM
jgi:hypothetical protein